MSGAECPTCGDEFDTKRGMKAHHQSHSKPYWDVVIETHYAKSVKEFLETQYFGEGLSVPEIAEMVGCSITAIEKMRDRHGIETKDRRKGDWFDCANCGEQKWVPDCRQDRANQFFCDKDCQRSWEESRHVEVECEWCGAPKEVYKTRAEEHEMFFCDWDGCGAEWLAANNTGEDHPRWKPDVEVKCAHCRSVKKVPPSIAERPRHFCGSECRSRWVSENLSGEQSPHWTERVTVECAHCGDAKELVPSVADRPRHFCNGECRSEWISENQTGEDHPNWTQQEVTCAWCEAELTFPQSRVEASKRHFCPDKDCYAQWQAENWVGEDHHQYDRVEGECHNCGTTIERQPSLFANSERSFCSSECEREWRMSEDYPVYSGGPAVYGHGWNKEKKEAVRERDGRECNHCGRTQEEHIELFGMRHHVHHIIPADQFENPEARNAMENLITLCTGKCHMTWEKMAPLRPDTNDRPGS